MGQEFVIKSQNLEDKINQLLPSQGGFAAGVDLSASTQIVPIVDLTETAEGSLLRQDLQSSLSLDSVTSFSVSNTTTTIIDTTGYFRIFGNYSATGTNNSLIRLTDGTTTKNLINFLFSTGGNVVNTAFDFVVFLEAGDSCEVVSNSAIGSVRGCTRQVADIAGNLVNP